MAAKKRARKKKTAIPLALRLPNPPAVFVGREADVEWVETAVNRAPVTLVTGPGGVGKTALVLAALHERFPRKIERTLYIDVPPGQPAGQVRQEVLRALADVAGEEPNWAELQSNPEAVTAAALDLAEAGGFFIVIDDVFRGEADETAEMLVQLATYARKSRWIATSRSSPRRPELAGQVLTLSAMSDDELSQLSGAWAPGADSVATRRAIAAASGSPWLLSQLLVTGSSTGTLESQSLLAGLSHEAEGFLRGLSIVDVPLPLSVLTLFAPDPGPEGLAHLERRGLTTESASGIRLHDVARGLLASGQRDDPEAQNHAAAILAQQESVDARLEALRIFTKLGRSEALSALLERDAESILANGYAPRLWKILRQSADPAVEAVKLRCAAELGNPTALAEVQKPAGSGAGETVAWARTLRASGDAEDALAQLDKVLAEKDAVEPAIVAEATLLAATCLSHLGRYEAAGRLLGELVVGEPGDPNLALARDAAIALAAVLGGGAVPHSQLAELRRRTLEVPTATAAARDLATAFLALGMLDDAATLAERGRPRGAGAVLLSNRESILSSARTALCRGDLAGARRLADEVRAFARGSSLLLPTLHYIDVARRLAAGELDGIEPFLEACVREVEEIDARADLELASLGTRIRIATAEPGGGGPRPAASPELAASRAGQELALWDALKRTRETGEPPPGAAALLATGQSDRRLSILGELLRATTALSTGDTASATHHAVEAVRLAVRFELAILEAHGRALLSDALLCAGRRTDLAREAGHFATLAEGIGSTRFAVEAELLLAAAHEGEGELTPARIERIAASARVAPVAARRAQALLGAEPPVDHLDLRVLESLAGATGPFVLLAGAMDAERWQPAWGIDEAASCAWLPDGRALPLSGQALRILVVLAERGGAASKEELVRAAWGEDEYHPLRHDGKLHVAVRKLREVLEEDPARPARLATTEEGYRLAGAVRWIPAG